MQNNHSRRWVILLIALALLPALTAAPHADCQPQMVPALPTPYVAVPASTSAVEPNNAITTRPSAKAGRLKSLFSRLKSLVKRKPKTARTPKPHRFSLHKPHLWSWKSRRQKENPNVLKAHVEKNVYASTEEAKLSAGLVKCSSDAHVVIHHGCTIDMQRGDVLVATRRQMIVRTGDISIVVKGGAITLISNRAGVTKIRNLSENRLESIQAFIDSTSFPLRAGQEVAVASDFSALQFSVETDSVNRRALSTFELPSGRQLMSCEFEPVTVIKHNALLRSLLHTSDRNEKAAFNAIMKMAACLQIATVGHGDYLPMAHDSTP